MPDFVIQMGDITVGDGTGGKHLKIRNSAYYRTKWSFFEQKLINLISNNFFVNLKFFAIVKGSQATAINYKN